MNDKTLKLNLSLLEAHHGIKANDLSLSEDRLSAFELIEGYDGEITLRYHFKDSERTILFHSLYSIEKEAEAYWRTYKSVDRPLVCIGFGLGHHLRQLLTAGKSMDILVLNDEAFFIALHFEWVTAFLKSPNVRFMLVRQTKAFNEYLSVIELDKDKTNLIIHTPSNQVRELMGDRIGIRLANVRLYARTYDWLKETLLENYEHNISTYKQYFKDIQPVLRGKSIVVTMSGPSLDADLEALRPYRDQFFMVSVASSLKTIKLKGMVPDLVVVQDALPSNFKHIDGIDWEVPMLAVSTSSRNVLDKWKGPVFLVFQKSLPFAHFIVEPQIIISGTVAFAAINMMLLSNPKEVILTGLDLCFSTGKTHAEGAVFRMDVESQPSLYTVENYEGELIPSDTLLMTYKMELEVLFKAARSPVYNLTHYGARLPHTQRISENDLGRIFKIKN